MHSNSWARIIVLALFSALAIPTQLAAQHKQHHPHQYHHCQINDVGTFGGPQSVLSQDWPPGPGILNNRGTLAGAADTLTVDPFRFWKLSRCDTPDAFQ